MTDQKPTAAELLAQIDNFENTIAALQKNVHELRSKLNKNKDQYGDDVASWPNL
ncbi:MAG: hypothetical protein HQ564_03815 [Candidatus Saganbacteria bacterium]|nr:hypothetical protein [Candidatus Saganbacteria bacterium]